MPKSQEIVNPWSMLEKKMLLLPVQEKKRATCRGKQVAIRGSLMGFVEG